MTKEQKKKLTWKLKEAPTAEGLASLVEQGILRPEEARDMLLNVTDIESEKEKIKALEKMIEFLQGLVTELAKHKSGTTFVPFTQTVYIDRPVKRYWEPIWMNTTKVLSDSGLKLDTVSAGTMSYASSVNGKVSSGAKEMMTMSVNLADSKIS